AYEHGRLVRGVILDDGRTCQDVTNNGRTLADAPHRLRGHGWPGEVKGSGEVHLPHAGFAQHNGAQLESCKEPFDNLRNAAARSPRLKDRRVTAVRPLGMLVHGFGAWRGGAQPKRQSETYELMRSWGLPVSDHYKVVDGMDAVREYIAEYGENRHGTPYEIDG